MKPRILDVGPCTIFTRGTDFIDLYPMRDDVKKCNADTDQFPYQNETFDEVVSFYLFEHLTNHANFMRECHRVLKKNGILTIHTDSAAYIGATILNDSGEKGEFGILDCHFALFTKKNMENWAERFGFETMSCKYTDEKGQATPSNPVKRIIKTIMLHIEPRLVIKGVELTARKK